MLPSRVAHHLWRITDDDNALSKAKDLFRLLSVISSHLRTVIWMGEAQLGMRRSFDGLYRVFLDKLLWTACTVKAPENGTRQMGTHRQAECAQML